MTSVVCKRLSVQAMRPGNDFVLIFSANCLGYELKLIKRRGDLCWPCLKTRELKPQQFDLLQDSLPELSYWILM